MKCIIVGLGKLGKALGQSLTAMGHDVIGVDHEMREVDAVKNMISTAICLDTRDENAVKTLPLKDADAVYVTYGEDFGDSIHTVAILKQLGVKRLIVRSISPLHETVLRSIGVHKIIFPEHDYSDEYAVRLHLGENMEHWYKVTPTHHMIRIRVPESLIDQRVQDIDFEASFNLKLVAILRPSDRKNLLGVVDKKFDVIDRISDDTVFIPDDRLILFGKEMDYNQFKEI